MKKILTLFSIAVLFAGCEDTEIQSSEVLHEKAVLVTTIFSPTEHHTELTQTAYAHGNNDIIGQDWDGNTGIRIGQNYQITSTTIPERNGVVFQCQHGTFTIEGTDQKYKILSQKLAGSIKDTIDILYKEQYLVTYQTDEKTKERKEVSRVLRKLDFIDAQILK